MEKNKYELEKLKVIDSLRAYNYNQFSLRQLKDMYEDVHKTEGEDL